jgi:hypothetical protein
MVKTDNHNPKAKLDLRRYFLNKYHSDDMPSVFDCCQGSAVMWSQLQKEFSVGSYWGVDLKPKKGRLKIDSVRILQQPGWSFDVIDVDTYGSPWRHWLAILPNLTKSTTIFLTIGSTMFKGSTDSSLLSSIGCVFSRARLPESMHGKLSEFGTSYILANVSNFAKITEAVEAVSTGNARYIGVRLEPIKKGLPVVDATSKPEHRKAVKEQCNV